MSSVIWTFFTVANATDTHAKCNKCGKLISRGGKLPKDFGTTGLKNHIRQHPGVFAAFETLSKKVAKEREQNKHPKSEVAGPAPNQQTLHDVYERAKPFDINDARARIIHRKIAEMMATDCQPIAIVTDVGFRRLVQHLEPRYQIPSRKYFQETVIPDIRQKVVDKVRTVLAGAGGEASFTSDIWTSDVNNDAFISLTAHFITTDFKRCNLVLHTRHFPGGHTGASIADSISQMLAEWSIPDCHCFVTDNGANIVKAIRDLQLTGIGCAAHTLQLCITAAIGSQRVVKDMVAVGRKIVGHFRHSSKACDKLTEVQKQLDLPSKKLVQDVVTRWNSTFYMLQSLLEQKRALVLYAADAKIEMLNGNQWAILEKAVEILQPCEDMSKKMCTNDATISMVGPLSKGLVRCLQNITDSGTGTMKDTLIQEIQQRFAQYLRQPVAISCLLDPRFKAAFFGNDDITDIKVCVLTMIGRTPDASPARSAAVDDIMPSSPKQIKVDLMSCMDEISGNPPLQPEVSLTSAATELEAYLAAPLIGKTTDILDWWKSNHQRFPRLAQLARRVLSTPATSVASERLFSIAGNILTDHRSRLTPRNAEQLIFLHENLRLLGYQY